MTPHKHKFLKLYVCMFTLQCALFYFKMHQNAFDSWAVPGTSVEITKLYRTLTELEEGPGERR